MCFQCLDYCNPLMHIFPNIFLSYVIVFPLLDIAFDKCKYKIARGLESNSIFVFKKKYTVFTSVGISSKIRYKCKHSFERTLTYRFMFCYLIFSGLFGTFLLQLTCDNEEYKIGLKKTITTGLT